MSCVLSSQQALWAGHVCDIVLLTPSDTRLGCHNPEQQHKTVTRSLRLAGTCADHPLNPWPNQGELEQPAQELSCSWGDPVIVLIL